MKLTLLDRQTYAISKRERTPEGFLRAPARIARTGIQQYLASELQLDGDPNRLVNVYRPAEEVFSADSLASFNAVDISDDHPSRLIDPENFSSTTRGVVSSIGERDGDYVKAVIIIKDADAIKKVESGKVQLSAGYTAEYDATPGTAPCGTEYEFIQRDIRINHVALVDAARAGPTARIFDTQTGGRKMALVTLDNGRSIELEDALAAQVEDSINRLKDTATASTKRADGLQAQCDGLTTDLDKAKQASSDEAVAAKVKAVADLMVRAKKIAGPDFVCDSVNPIDIQRAALAAVKDGKWKLDGQPDAYISAAFDMQEGHMEEEEEGEAAKKKAAEDSRKGLTEDMSKDGTPKPTPKQNYDAGLTDAWKATAGVQV